MEIILAKYGEIALKGGNKRFFEDLLVKNSKHAVSRYGVFAVSRKQSTLYFTASDNAENQADIRGAATALGKVFGIGNIQIAAEFPKDLPTLLKDGVAYIKDKLPSPTLAFKVVAKRADKKFPFDSPHIAEEFGAAILAALPTLTVDVHNPDINIYAEVRDNGIYVSVGREKGAGGIPVGASGKAVVLLSGGLDSPVAAYLAAKRGLTVIPLHFESPPYTSARARQKVETLCEKLVPYCGDIKLRVNNLTVFQELLRDKCAEIKKDGYFTVLLRREMLRRANTVCAEVGADAIITGESLAQVASQTLPAIACTDNAADYPVLRPLIMFDKTEITDIARRIDTFDTSSLPYEDCCTVFTPKHPRLNPKLEDILEIEQKLDILNL
ncbi:MAG: tRNA 4-thiouridine(8) synthase ThiI [Oscillospiraceae bacterium]|jgi:thiamine biosynthesis protein ThiI|nr:tRNA 4-thiouridine(8) synthase ThiI [Oscillospiraceae bacterium]